MAELRWEAGKKMFGEVGTQIVILKKRNSLRKHATHENEQPNRSREEKADNFLPYSNPKTLGYCLLKENRSLILQKNSYLPKTDPQHT